VDLLGGGGGVGAGGRGGLSPKPGKTCVEGEEDEPPSHNFTKEKGAGGKSELNKEEKKKMITKAWTAKEGRGRPCPLKNYLGGKSKKNWEWGRATELVSREGGRMGQTAPETSER